MHTTTMYILKCTHTHTLLVYTQMHTHPSYARIKNELRLYPHAYTYTHAHTCAHTCIHIHTHTYTYMHAHTHTHACTYTHTHTHTHTHNGELTGDALGCRVKNAYTCTYLILFRKIRIHTVHVSMENNTNLRESMCPGPLRASAMASLGPGYHLLTRPPALLHHHLLVAVAPCNGTGGPCTP